ncbi:hypothetical protein [Pseudorhizobium marinum]|uniref:hypothetical protein n=1 Tax=Pseudorhizobium marinum TaxID=1496690 RepID=UPI0004960700|nr:hypothetical protein [Pseudorhizobium marinum]
MIGKQLLLVALASGLFGMMELPAIAGGNDWRDGGSRGHSLRDHGHSDFRNLGRSIGYTTPVTHVPGVGTFSRSVWVIRRTEKVDRPQPAPKATIIQVDESYLRRSDPCSCESGVCVIRAAN